MAADRHRFENYDTDSTADDSSEPLVAVNVEIQVDNILNELQQEIDIENQNNNKNTIENIVKPIIEEISPPEIVHVSPDIYHPITPETLDTTFFDYYYNLNVFRTNSQLKAIK